MALRFIRERVEFDPTQGRIQEEPRTVAFPSNVRSAHVALNGFDVSYSNGDHHVLRQIVDVGDPVINGNAVTYNVRLLLRDGSGNIDDRFHGTVDTLIIADTVS